MAERNSFDSSSVTVSARWKARDDETGWQLTYDEIVNYRSGNNVTIKGFLELCDLPPKSYYLQLCSASGKNIHPSNKPGSVGRKFLDAVAKFFEEQSDPPPHVLRMDAIVTDLNLDHIDDLRQLGIFRLGIDVDKKKLTVTCSDTVEETKIIDYLRKASLEVDELVVEFRHMELLLTCAHCVGQVESPVQTIEQGDDFGIKLKDCSLDFAIIKPSHSLPIAMNNVHHDQLYHDLEFEEFWDFDENPGSLRTSLLNKVVCKIGYTTGMTQGTIVDVDETH
mmetsp:Transcript_1141/g.1562  ORF Transcript_1141/g.1562 Transcript_1141/m.1562 type:complete len:279 (+) Transcript_1141:130-966(+)